MPHRNGLPPSLTRSGIWFLSLLALLFALACRGQPAAASKMEVTLSIAPDPPVVGPAVIRVQVRDTGGSLLGGAVVEVEGNMTHAGMVPVLAPAVEQEKGLYVADRFRFTMGGDWFLTVRVALPDGRRLEKVFTVKGVGSSTATPGERWWRTDR